MGVRFHSWWQQIKLYRKAIGILLVVVIALVIVGYWFDWTGFNGYYKVSIARTISGTSTGTVIRTEEYQPGKTLWDWLQLLIIPLVLAVTALLFNLATTRAEQKITTQRYEQDQHIALDKQREDLLQTYLDRMSELLLEKSLRTSPSEEVRNVARVRTITILFQLDARRIGYVFAFLRESGLMSTKPNDSVVSLNQANLKKINFSQAALNGVDLRGAFLRGADLRGANLLEADLSEANLSEADLSGAYLYEADLSGTYLMGAHLMGAHLGNADLSGAYLYEADLSGAYLSGATITEEQLKEVKSLQDATMPDGSKHA